MGHVITDNTDRRRYELWVDDELAALATYGRSGGLLALTHTETEEGFEHQGLATELIAHVVSEVQEQGLGILPFCPFVRHYLQDHPETLTLVPADQRSDFGLSVPAP